jgi:tetratricopeptide (TPR) repeat protein
MSDAQPNQEATPEGEVETALLDADLFLKYKASDRAMLRLRTALELHPRSIRLRERLREIAAINKNMEESARQCLALASLYIERDEFDMAYDRLLEAKNLDPRISIASGLEAIRRARRPDLSPSGIAAARRDVTLAGDLAIISLFDAVQVVENTRLTGVLVITGDNNAGRIFFNEGRIVDAETEDNMGEEAFQKTVEMTSGIFDFARSTQPFPIKIKAPSNTNLILDTLRRLDEENVGEKKDKADQSEEDEEDFDPFA